MAEIGDVKMSYLINSLDGQGREVNGGMSYANADTIEGALDWARRWLEGGAFSVSIYGRELRLGWQCWQELPGGKRDFRTVTRAELGLPPKLLNSARPECQKIHVEPYETWHSMLTDGSCVCGETRPTES